MILWRVNQLYICILFKMSIIPFKSIGQHPYFYVIFERRSAAQITSLAEENLPDFI